MFLHFNVKVRLRTTQGTNHIFYKRKTLKIMYPFKIWIIRYKNWMIIFWFFFQPKYVLKNEINKSYISKSLTNPPFFKLNSLKINIYRYMLKKHQNKVYNF